MNKQRADLTFKANKSSGRHGWLRLTPAYSLKLVQERLAALPSGTVVLEPFSGSGTTPLVAQELGLRCQAREINPFLVWFGNAKLDEYNSEDAKTFKSAGSDVSCWALNDFPNHHWTPPLFAIEKWWNAPTLQALASLKHYIDSYDGKLRNLLDVAFCRVMIGSSNAAFNHQSMSFKSGGETVRGCERKIYYDIIGSFSKEVSFVYETLASSMLKSASVCEGNSTQSFVDFPKADFVITSPPYANRMSYIREMRPYMYWLGYLNSGAAAGDLDWQTTGGTWGIASSKIKDWMPDADKEMPIQKKLDAVCGNIRNGKSGEILSPYVRKYFWDMWKHFKAITPVVNHGGRLCYIVGNSTFSGCEVPTQEWYGDMLASLGYVDINIEVIRKRNSNKKLYEYAVCAARA